MTKVPSRHAIIFVLLCVLLDMIGFGLIIPVLPALIEQVGQVSLAEASLIGGWMFFAFSMAQFAFSPLMGNLSDRFGRRPLLLLAIAGLGVDNLLQGFAPTLVWLFIGRAIAGLCGSSWVIANAFITDITAPAERAKYFGMMGGGVWLGLCAGAGLGWDLGRVRSAGAILCGRRHFGVEPDLRLVRAAGNFGPAASAGF